MKLQTTIKPRKDGSVIALGLDGKKYTFSPDDTGDLVCDVTHAPTVTHLLLTEWYCPVNEIDMDVAIGLTTGATELDEDDDSDLNALPLEAGTPPKPARAKPGPKPKAKL